MSRTHEALLALVKNGRVKDCATMADALGVTERAVTSKLNRARNSGLIRGTLRHGTLTLTEQGEQYLTDKQHAAAEKARARARSRRPKPATEPKPPVRLGRVPTHSHPRPTEGWIS